jgi:hypothetical protein
MNSEQMHNQEDDACDEGAEEEIEVTICSNLDSKSNGKNVGEYSIKQKSCSMVYVGFMSDLSKKSFGGTYFNCVCNHFGKSSKENKK